MATQTTNLLNPNQQFALRSLARAISLPENRFSLILVRGNCLNSSAHIVQALKDEQGVGVQTLCLSVTAATLYSELEKLSLTSQGLIVFGLENVINQDEFLIATNQMRNEFPKRFPFPITLWVDDATLRKLIRLAPDFYSWANTPIHFD